MHDGNKILCILNQIFNLKLHVCLSINGLLSEADIKELSFKDLIYLIESLCIQFNVFIFFKSNLQTPIHLV